jgi:hypothetical protein
MRRGSEKGRGGDWTEERGTSDREEPLGRPKLEKAREQIEAAIEQRLRQRTRRNRRMYLLIEITSR